MILRCNNKNNSYSWSVKLGLMPLAIASLAGVLWMLNLKTAQNLITPEIVIYMLVLFTTTLAFTHYTLSRYPSFHMLPAAWAILLLVEFVLSPLVDACFGAFYDDHGSSASLLKSIIACILFVTGLWGGLISARILQRKTHTPKKNEQAIFQTATNAAIPVIISFAVISLLTELYVIWVSGAISGNITFARGEGQMGTSLFIPLLRLVNIGTLLSSQLSIVDTRAVYRRKFQRLALLSTACAMVMPIMLGQRFGIIQAIGYLALPKLASGTWLSPRQRKLIFTYLSISIIGVGTINIVTSQIRESLINHNDIEWSTFFNKELVENATASHFRHLALLSELIEQGVDEAHFGGLYDGTPIIGDMLIFIPRILFPGKPITSMEVVNGVAGGDSFSAIDRGSRSVHTSSLWVQLYILGSNTIILTLSFIFGLLSTLLWGWASSKSHSMEHLIISSVLWFVFGWLAFNVSLTTIEIPGMILAIVVIRIFPISVVAKKYKLTSQSSVTDANRRCILH